MSPWKPLKIALLPSRDADPPQPPTCGSTIVKWRPVSGWRPPMNVPQIEPKLPAGKPVAEMRGETAPDQVVEPDLDLVVRRECGRRARVEERPWPGEQRQQLEVAGVGRAFARRQVHGFDALGHYLRAGLVTNNCSSYVLRPASSENCNARFFSSFGDAAADLTSHTAEFDKNAQKSNGSVSPQGTLLQGLIGAGDDPSQTRERDQGIKRLRQGANGQSEALQGEEPMLDYLLGGER